MDYFLDTEFIELAEAQSIDLISIGIVTQDGRRYEAISNEFDPSTASEWVKENVLSKLPPRPGSFNPAEASPRQISESKAWKSRATIKQELLEFIIPDEDGINFWGAWSAYDWVVFCWIFGCMNDLPKGYPYYCNDVIQWMNQLGLTRESVPPDPIDAHNALADALWTRSAWETLNTWETIKKNPDNLSAFDLTNSYLKGANLINTYLRDVDFSLSNLCDADIEGCNLTNAILKNVNLTNANLYNANLTNGVLLGANLTNANLHNTILINADLRAVNFSGADLGGADLTDARLEGAIGLGTREEEIAFASWLLDLIGSGKGKLEMNCRHQCDTAHCIAGWAFPNLKNPVAPASRLYPTLAKYFYVESNELAVSAIELVATGGLSVFPD
jgi:hypothetical protein